MIARMTARPSPHRFCVAPMMGCTDRHARYLMRLLSRRARLYTEMVPTGAVIHGDASRALRFDEAEHPVAVQLGGSDSADLARCARRAEAAGFDEVNLNVGCPSPRVQRGCFGAALMARPDLVAECVAAMRDAASIPVTVKTRIGIDELDSYAEFRDFAGTVTSAGCGTLIVHARKAWLTGLSPRQNREIPPLRHDRVYRLKRDLPHVEVVLNGGLADLEAAGRALARVDGVMLGRAAYHDLWLLAGVDRILFGDAAPSPERGDVVAGYFEYARRQDDARLAELVRPLLGLFRGAPGARRWRRTLGELSHRPGATIDLVAGGCGGASRVPAGRRSERAPVPRPPRGRDPASRVMQGRPAPALLGAGRGAPLRAPGATLPTINRNISRCSSIARNIIRILGLECPSETSSEFSRMRQIGVRSRTSVKCCGKTSVRIECSHHGPERRPGLEGSANSRRGAGLIAGGLRPPVRGAA